MLSGYWRDEERTWYDTAQICRNGHLITSFADSKPADKKEFCDECGASTITTCQNDNCKAPLQGFQHNGVGFSYKYTASRFCYKCGQMYPWTEERLNAAQELVEELNLSKEDQEVVKQSIRDLTQNGPRTQIAAARFNRLVAKTGSEVATMVRDAIVDILSDDAKKALFPQK